MQDTDGTSLGPARVLVQTTGFENECAESRLSNGKQWHCIAGVPDLLSPKPNGMESPACKIPEAGDAVRPQGQAAEGRLSEPSNGQMHETISVETLAKMERGNTGQRHRSWMLGSTMAKTDHWCIQVCHLACTTRTGLPEVGQQVELNCAGSEGSWASVEAGVGTVGPKC